MAFLSVSEMKKHRLFVFGLFLAYLFQPSSAFGGIIDVHVDNDTRFTGRGNRHELLCHLTVTADSETNLKALRLDLCKTDLTDIEKMEMFSTDTLNRFDERHPKNALLIGAILPKNKTPTSSCAVNCMRGKPSLADLQRVGKGAGRQRDSGSAPNIVD